MLGCCEDKAAARARSLAAVRAAVEAAAVQAKERLVPLAESAAERARPVVDSAIAKVADVVTTEIRPHLAELREQATPLITDVGQRGRLAVAALAGAAPVVVAAEPPKAKRGHPVLKFIGIAAIVAVIGLLIRAILDSRDDSWEKDEIFDDDIDDIPAEEIIVVAEEPLQGVIPMDESPADPLRYGPDSFIGTEPPAGFDIKANERSMKYHVPTAIGYQRCVTDVWFNSAEAAERAGFTRALR